MDIAALHKKFTDCHQKISTDTRMIESGSIYFGWKGEKNDGSSFAKEALEKGAHYAVIDNPDFYIDERTIVVTNAIETLQHLARFHRQQFNIPIVAIGGSNGKTTTKELLARIFESQKNTIASFGSENNHTGVPKTLLRINALTEIVILELGANHVGEIHHLCHIAQPTAGLVTNIGRDHIGLFGSEQAIRESNLELYKYLMNVGGHVFVDKNEPVLMAHASASAHRTCYGVGLETEFGIRSEHTSPFVSFFWNESVMTKLTGEYNLQNICAAIAVGVHFGIQSTNIISAIRNFHPSPNRSEIIETETNVVLKDFYNANRTSMELALDNLVAVGKKYPDKKIIAIMGDMLELGVYGPEEHAAVLKYAHRLDIDDVIIIGPEFCNIKAEGDIFYRDVDEALSFLGENNIRHSVVLLKASNGTNFQKLFDEINW